MKILIVGGVAGGATAAARLRRLDENSKIVMFERGKYISYANCGLPYYIGGKIRDREDILIQTPESFTERFNVDVRVEQEVTAVRREAREVIVKDHKTGKEYRETYDKLVLAPGAEPLRPNIGGVQSARVFTLRSVPDADGLKDFIAQRVPKRVVVVGAGYIGLEMAENLHRLGIFVTIIEMAPQVIAPLDFEMAALVHQHLKTKNVEFYLGEQVASFRDEDKDIIVALKSGIEIRSDFVIMSAGIRPETRLAKDAGLALGESGAITVNEFLQTSDENIYAVGDAVETVDPIFGQKRLVPLAGPANKQARIAANNIVFGNKEKYAGTVATAIAKVFDLTVGVTGFSERALQAKKIPYETAIIHGVSNAGYYPGAMPLSLKILFAKDSGKIYGAQAVGYKGVDKATEVLSLACQLGLSLHEMKLMDQAYAPPFSSVKSPVNMIACVAENILTGKTKTVGWREVPAAGSFLLDVRTVDEYALGRIEGSVNIPLHELRGRLHEIPHDRPVIVYCAVGLRGYVAERILRQKGFSRVTNLSGGYKTWENATMKQSNEDIFEKYCIGKDDMMYLLGRGGECAVTPPQQTAKKPETPRGVVDCRGLQCPGPIVRVNERLPSFAAGETFTVFATDPGFVSDIKAWAGVTGNELLEVKQEQGEIAAVIRKSAAVPGEGPAPAGGNDKTIIVFSDDFDRAFAAFVIANGALAMGRKVTMFFTFWGLNILKKKKSPRLKKDIFSRAFGVMLPKGTDDLKLSKLNMFGMGPKLMNHIMKQKNIDALPVMLEQALQGGATIIACQMSMDVMGIRKEELMDGIQYGGVATYIAATEKANMSLFI